MPQTISSIIGFFLLMATASAGAYFVSRMRALRSPGASSIPPDIAGRYRPMLRLLSEDDFNFVSVDAPLCRKLRSERRKLFRSYLRCLTLDYARVLDGIRLTMVHAKVDRPDLARALAKNRTLFALALCRVEFRLALHACGVGSVDISSLVNAADVLRRQAAAFSAPLATH